MDIEISFITNKFLGDKSVAENLFCLLKNNKILKPNKIGRFEPLKDNFPENFNDFLKYWYDEKFKNINTLMWVGGGNKENNGFFEYGKRKNLPIFNKLSLSFAYKKNSQQQDEFQGLINELHVFFDNNDFIFGRMNLTQEYDKYNILKDTDFFFNEKGEKIFFDDGGSCPILPVGTDIKKHIPGIYWKTLFGKPYVDWIGKEKIIKAPCFKINELTNGSVELQAYENPEDYNTETAMQQVKKIKDYLGNDIFFDIADIDRKTKAPKIDVSEIVIS
jgi:hypothetical protein